MTERKEGARASYTGTIRYKHGQKILDLKVRLFAIPKAPLLARQRIYYKDKQGNLATKQSVELITRKPVKTTFIWINEKLEEVQGADVLPYTKQGDIEQTVQPFEKTELIELGVPLSPTQEAELMAEDYYDVEVVKEEDIPTMYEIVKDLTNEKISMGGTIVFRHGWTKLGIVISPRVDTNTRAFALIAKTVADKIVPQAMYSIPSDKPAPVEKAPTLTVADPFAGL